jgi:glycosyltransferase involved in cell wall biosynthesis
VEHIYCYNTVEELTHILDALPHYRVFQTLWVESIWAFFSKKMRKKCERLNLFIGGSDYYRASPGKLEFKRRLIEVADIIGIETETVRDDFIHTYPEAKDKIAMLRYGLEYIEKEEYMPPLDERFCHWGIPEGKMVFTCAHNAVRAQRHIEMIRALNKMPDSILDKSFFVFPMTYGDSNGSYIDEVEKELEQTNLNYKIYREYMDSSEFADLISLSDLYIHVQTTDTLSTTMLEELYKGAVAVMGSWFPYDALEQRGIFYVKVDSIDELTETVTDVVEHYAEYKEKCANNRKIIHEMSSWDNMSKEWMKAWTL